MTDSAPSRPSDRWVGAWLVAMAGLVAAMVIVGGLTRLTDSGLSITEWRPVSGALPPLSQEAWAEEFAKYKQIPEYQLQNRGMSLDAFKTIYWWEWGHRQLGRFIGAAFLLPLIVFWIAGAVRPHLRARLAGLFVLGGLQGAVGWWMVASGLVDRVDVSQHRLAVHLVIAFILLIAIWWTALDAFNGARRRSRSSPVAVMAGACLVLVVGQVALGALVAGLDAGRIYTTWPLMEGRFAPDSYAALEPWWRNLFDNRAAVQFNHRLGGYGLTAAALTLAAAAAVHPDAGVRWLSSAFAAGTLAQAGLGVLTLTEGAPMDLAIAHQGAAVVLAVLAASLTRQALLSRAQPAAPAAPPRPHRPAPAR
ncbi:MAG: COX15/CtaA family protein [Caulobacterales bacterium]|nr:COX15/CtaA family protein [Caulobacterales bacterium]